MAPARREEVLKERREQKQRRDQEQEWRQTWLEEEEKCFKAQHKKDNLMTLPTLATATYMNSKNQLTFDNRYETKRQRDPIGERHPKLLKAEKNKTVTARLHAYWVNMPPRENKPLAGIPREPEVSCSRGDQERELAFVDPRRLPEDNIPYLSWLEPQHERAGLNTPTHQDHEQPSDCLGEPEHENAALPRLQDCMNQGRPVEGQTAPTGAVPSGTSTWFVFNLVRQ